MALAVTFKKLVDDDKKLLIEENKETPQVKDNLKNTTSKKLDRYKSHVIVVLTFVCLILGALLGWNSYLTYYQTHILGTGISGNNLRASDIIDIGKKLQEVKLLINNTNAHLENSFSVGFQAFLYSDGGRHYHDKVEFDNNVNYNMGNGYNRSTGIFTVPPGKGGLYFFNTFLQFDDYESGEFRLVVGEAIRCWIRGDDNGSGNDFDSGSCESLQHLKPGDTAYVRRYFTGYSVKYAVFSGFLLKSDV